MLAVIELVVIPGQLCALFVGKARWLVQYLLFPAFFIFCGSSDVFRFAGRGRHAPLATSFALRLSFFLPRVSLGGASIFRKPLMQFCSTLPSLQLLLLLLRTCSSILLTSMSLCLLPALSVAGRRWWGLNPRSGRENGSPPF